MCHFVATRFDELDRLEYSAGKDVAFFFICLLDDTSCVAAGTFSLRNMLSDKSLSYSTLFKYYSLHFVE
jgi:hypothetical protein